ncbi:phosphate ABC transporter substrate-binding protein [uncultured Ruthenibacterium sp.]|uniref:phosphate ABC transporter substrate-binding protein n=1 Tax=uncultured Ruthenibacterium sp. TaxID=1905347 RepID=UPI00349E6CC5
MKRTSKVLAFLTIGAMLLAGCGQSTSSSTAASTAEQSEATASSTATEELSGKVSTGGSTSMEAVVGAFQEAFAEKYPGVDVTYDPTGSGAGITGAQEGSLDIGLSSRALKEDETGVTGTTIALDGIAIIVNSENPVADLTIEQLAGIAKGEITNWSEVGGEDAEIVFIGREAGSGTRDGFESIVGVEDSCVYSEELTATGAVIAKVQSNANAIGYASLSALDDTVKAVTVEGVAPSEETVQDGTYKIQRPFVFVTNDSAELSEAAQAFFDFAQSDEASDLIRAAGAVPLA